MVTLSVLPSKQKSQAEVESNGCLWKIKQDVYAEYARAPPFCVLSLGLKKYLTASVSYTFCHGVICLPDLDEVTVDSRSCRLSRVVLD